MNIKNSIDYTWKDDEYETPGISKDLQKILKKINNLEFNYYYHITYLGLTYYTNLVLNARFFLNSNNFNKFIKVIFLSIYLEYFNNILNIINNNTNYDNIISDIKELVVDISNYYYNLKEFKELHDDLNIYTSIYMGKLRQKGKAVDHVVPLASVFRDAPGYTEAGQIIDFDINKEKVQIYYHLHKIGGIYKKSNI